MLQTEQQLLKLLAEFIFPITFVSIQHIKYTKPN